MVVKGLRFVDNGIGIHLAGTVGFTYMCVYVLLNNSIVNVYFFFFVGYKACRFTNTPSCPPQHGPFASHPS